MGYYKNIKIRQLKQQFRNRESGEFGNNLRFDFWLTLIIHA